MGFSAIRTAARAALAFVLLSGAASAATIGFDGDKPKKGEAYAEGGFLFGEIRIVNGNCLAGSCAALNDNESFTMSRADGALFDLSEIGFSLLGEGKVIRARDKTPSQAGGNTLTLTTDQAVSVSFSTSEFKHNKDHVVSLDPKLFTGLRSIAFSTGGGGNVRLDNFFAASAAASGAQAPAVPLPATAWLLLGGLGALGFLRRRRA
ncbi:MAG: VPLPA-CTERM sorting domain-containing protein [Pikeienuella sp.]|uniref:VPLPA-CTERM sorting domain-containing protein n=1 Tax=Pikeienuella sp. TaxID=2831957 RepID=UPI0039196E24